MTINPIVTEGVPAAVLCEAAEGADLLVIGRGHHSSLRERLLGSVAQRGPALRTLPRRRRDAQAAGADEASSRKPTGPAEC